MEDIQVIPSCHDGGMISLIQSHALVLIIFASLNLKASIGMYSRCDYPLQIFNFIQLFLYLFLFFFILIVELVLLRVIAVVAATLEHSA